MTLRNSLYSALPASVASASPWFTVIPQIGDSARVTAMIDCVNFFSALYAQGSSSPEVSEL